MALPILALTSAAARAGSALSTSARSDANMRSFATLVVAAAVTETVGTAGAARSAAHAGAVASAMRPMEPISNRFIGESSVCAGNASIAARLVHEKQRAAASRHGSHA
jgi:hypothetical protein